ncbi:hypothetical protein P7C73_g700, partial [Tremellales sp. Uapishka_1]
MSRSRPPRGTNSVSSSSSSETGYFTAHTSFYSTPGPSTKPPSRSSTFLLDHASIIPIAPNSVLSRPSTYSSTLSDKTTLRNGSGERIVNSHPVADSPLAPPSSPTAASSKMTAPAKTKSRCHCFSRKPMDDAHKAAAGVSGPKPAAPAQEPPKPGGGKHRIFGKKK